MNSPETKPQMLLTQRIGQTRVTSLFLFSRPHQEDRILILQIHHRVAQGLEFRNLFRVWSINGMNSFGQVTLDYHVHEVIELQGLAPPGLLEYGHEADAY